VKRPARPRPARQSRSRIAAFAPPKLASLLFAFAALAVLYVLLEVLYRRRWFLRA